MKSIFFVLIVTLAPFVLSNCGFEDKYYGSSISVNSPGMAVDAYETEAEINLVANCPWTSSIDYSSGDQWCTLTPSNGIGDTKIKVEMLPHNGPTRRTAIVTFRAQDELGQTISYSITQRGTAYYFDFDPTVVNNIFEIGEEAGTVVFTFFAGTSWIAEKVGTDNEWLTLNSTSGDKGDITFGMDVSQNGGTRPRNAEILFSSIEKPENTALITIRQIRTLPATVASVINNNQFTLNWNAVANVTKFDLIVKNANDKAIISTITDLPATTLTYDLTTINYGTYVGAVSLEVKSYFDNDDELYSYSLPITTHCRFDEIGRAHV